jgi:hypothetical protein
MLVAFTIYPVFPFVWNDDRPSRADSKSDSLDHSQKYVPEPVVEFPQWFRKGIQYLSVALKKPVGKTIHKLAVAPLLCKRQKGGCHLRPAPKESRPTFPPANTCVVARIGSAARSCHRGRDDRRVLNRFPPGRCADRPPVYPRKSASAFAMASG